MPLEQPALIEQVCMQIYATGLWSVALPISDRHGRILHLYGLPRQILESASTKQLLLLVASTADVMIAELLADSNLR